MEGKPHVPTDWVTVFQRLFACAVLKAKQMSEQKTMSLENRVRHSNRHCGTEHSNYCCEAHIHENARKDLYTT